MEILCFSHGKCIIMKTVDNPAAFGGGIKPVVFRAAGNATLTEAAECACRQSQASLPGVLSAGINEMGGCIKDGRSRD